MNINRINIYLVMNIFLALSAAVPTIASIASADFQPDGGIVLELNDSTVDGALREYPFLIIDVYKPACDPCRRMLAALQELSTELAGQAVFGLINGKENQVTHRGYNISSYPTLLIFENATLADRREGFASKSYIVDNLRRVKPDLNTSRVSYA